MADILPAGYVDDVFAVAATADGAPVRAGDLPDASGTVLLSSAIDVAVPVFDAISLAANGSTCHLGTVATSWAAGIGGGVVALLRSAYPNDNVAQIEARLELTADGVVGAPTTATGAGVLQPAEALTQDLSPTRQGVVDDMERQRVEQPRLTAPEARDPGRPPPPRPPPLLLRLSSASLVVEWGVPRRRGGARHRARRNSTGVQTHERRRTRGTTPSGTGGG